MYALRHLKNGKYLGFRGDANPPESFSVGVEYRLELDGDNVWVVTDLKVAQNAAVNSAEWYNAGFETPTNEYAGECEVIELVRKMF